MGVQYPDLFTHSGVDLVSSEKKDEVVVRYNRVNQGVKGILITEEDYKILEEGVSTHLSEGESEGTISISYYSDKREAECNMVIGFKINTMSDFSSSEVDPILSIDFKLDVLSEDEKGYLKENKENYDQIMEQVVRKAYYGE